jgi:hypothetical protein
LKDADSLKNNSKGQNCPSSSLASAPLIQMLYAFQTNEEKTRW